MDRVSTQRPCGSAANVVAPLHGAFVGPAPGYQIDSFIDSGYRADVFGVIALESGSRYAAKAFPREQRDAARNEVRALRTFTHPRLPMLECSFDDASWSFVILELIEGPNLRIAVGTSGPLAVPDTVRIGMEVCEVLVHIAAQGWTYRDLHPKNIHPHTHKGTMVLDLDGARPPGTPPQLSGRAGYGAPELESGPRVQPACDVYSLAGCLYFALVGEDPPAEPAVLPGLSDLLDSAPALANALHSCRRLDPSDRPTAEALHAVLAPYAIGKPVSPALLDNPD